MMVVIGARELGRGRDGWEALIINGNKKFSRVTFGNVNFF